MNLCLFRQHGVPCILKYMGDTLRGKYIRSIITKSSRRLDPSRCLPWLSTHITNSTRELENCSVASGLDQEWLCEVGNEEYLGKTLGCIKMKVLPGSLKEAISPKHKERPRVL